MFKGEGPGPELVIPARRPLPGQLTLPGMEDSKVAGLAAEVSRLAAEVSRLYAEVDAATARRAAKEKELFDAMRRHLVPRGQHEEGRWDV